MSRSDTTSRVVIAIVVLALLFFGFFAVNPLEHAETNEAEISNPAEGVGDAHTQKATIEITDEDGIMGEKEEASLTDVENIGTPFGGTAYRWNENGKYMHSVVATLAPPRNGQPDSEKKGLAGKFLEDGFFYEGWIVGGKIIPDVVSTGPMTYDAETGQYNLEFSSEEDYSKHDEVVITLEPDDGDPAPAGHVLEGSF